MKSLLVVSTALLAFDATHSFASDALQAGRLQSATATADDAANKSLLRHHLDSFGKHDLDALMSDYTSESVLMTADATYKGPQEIRKFFVNLIAQFPKQKSVFELDKMLVGDGVALIFWHAKTPVIDVPFATDTFVFKAGKIFRQTFGGQVNVVGK